jgi:hypothetical protein
MVGGPVSTTVSQERVVEPMTIYGERLARVEVEVQELKREFIEHKAETKKELSDMNGKLDDLVDAAKQRSRYFLARFRISRDWYRRCVLPVLSLLLSY